MKHHLYILVALMLLALAGCGKVTNEREPDLVVSGDAFSILLNRPGLCDVQDLRRQTLLEAKRTLARVNA